MILEKVTAKSRELSNEVQDQLEGLDVALEDAGLRQP